MNGLPYYKAYPRDFIEGTVGMPFEIKAAYRLLLDLIYMQSGRLPDDARYIAGLMGCSVRKWNGIRAYLIDAGKITAENGIISNFRADKELETSRKLQENQRENASKPRKTNDLREPRQNQRARLESESESYREPKGSPPLYSPNQESPNSEAQCDEPDDDATASASDHDPATGEAAEPGGADAGGGGTARGRRAGGSGGGAADRKPAAKSPSRRRQFPEDWWPTDAGCAYAEQQGCPDLDANVAACVDFHRSRGNTFADLDAAWRTWCRNACKYGWAGSGGGQAAAYGGRGGGYSNAGDRARQATDRMSRAAAEIAAEWDERDRAGADPGGSGAVPVVDLAAYRDGGSGGW